MASSNPRIVKTRDRAGRIRKEEGVSPLIAEACAGIDALLEAAGAGESLEGLATIRTRKLELKPREYGPKEVRRSAGSSRPARRCSRFMGVNTQTVQLLGTGEAEGAADGAGVISMTWLTSRRCGPLGREVPSRRRRIDGTRRGRLEQAGHHPPVGP